MRLPDPQHAYLDALRKHADENLPDSVVGYIMGGEPESVVFTGDWLDENCMDDDERYDTVMQVGARDLSAKISYWERMLRDQDVLSMTEEEGRDGCLMHAEMAAERRAGC